MYVCVSFFKMATSGFVGNLCEQSRATTSCVEQEDEFALGVADLFSQTMERGQRHNDQTSTEVQLCPANKRTIATAPQMHTC